LTDINFAYASGVIAGDGWIDWGNASPRIGLDVRDKHFANTFANALKSLGLVPRQTYRTDRNAFVVRATAKKELVNSLLNWKMVLAWSTEEQLSFLVGLFDSEGTVYNYPSHHSVVFSNFNKELVYLCYVLLKKLGINHWSMRIYQNRQRKKGKEYLCYQLYIFRLDNLRLLDKMKIFSIPRKAELLHRGFS
jgi:hypothetical protein